MTDGLEALGGDRAAAAQVLASLQSLDTSAVPVVVLAVLPPGRPVEVSQLQCTVTAASALSTVVNATATEYVQCEAIDYQPAGSPADGQVMWMESQVVPLLRQLLDDSSDLASLPLFDPQATRLAYLGLAAVRVETDDLKVILVQSLSKGQVVARSTKVGVVIHHGVLDIPDGEIIMLSSNFIAVLTDQFVFFRNRKTFQQIFGLMEVMRQQAAATFADVTSQLRIDGLDQMRAAVTGAPAMLGKMASIQRKLDQYPKYREALTMPKLAAFVGKHPECGVEIAGEGEDAQFIFHTDPQRRFKILKLLDDDYLTSELTTLDYEANSKSAPLGGTT
jgi:hypothetical protein